MTHIFNNNNLKNHQVSSEDKQELTPLFARYLIISQKVKESKLSARSRRLSQHFSPGANFLSLFSPPRSPRSPRLQAGITPSVPPSLDSLQVSQSMIVLRNNESVPLPQTSQSMIVKPSTVEHKRQPSGSSKSFLSSPSSYTTSSKSTKHSRHLSVDGRNVWKDAIPLSSNNAPTFIVSRSSPRNQNARNGNDDENSSFEEEGSAIGKIIFRG